MPRFTRAAKSRPDFAAAKKGKGLPAKAAAFHLAGNH